MCATLQHRGPDGHGRWVGNHAAIGHVRLSIIDIDGGAQPMTMAGRRGGTLAISYNGELYNFRKLRAQLQGHGRIFLTDSDTEVVLQAFDEWGPRCVERFTGMFAFAVFDTHTRTLTLARDPLGVKPLFYCRSEDLVVFGSEEKALLAHPDVEPVLDGAGVAELFCLTPMVNRSRSVLRGLRQVEPGHIVTLDAGREAAHCYWRLEPLAHRDDVDTTSGRLREMLTESVRGQLVSDVGVGTMLSGGVDSSAIAALAVGQLGQGLATYDIDYASVNTNYNASALQVERDSPWAHEVAAHIGSTHSTRSVATEEMLAAQEHTLHVWGRPMHRLLSTSMYLLFRHIRDSGTTVVLGGEGADEAFGGYTWWRDEPVTALPWHRTYRDASPLVRRDIAEPHRLADYAADSYAAVHARIPKLDGESAADRRAREVSWLTYTFYLDFLLSRVDRMSMAASVESRVPFCDHELVQYAWNIPWEMKNHGGIEKGILRRAVTDLLPQRVVMRRKSGYPSAQTAEYQRVQYYSARVLSADRDAPVWQLVDRAAVADILARRESNNADWTDLNRIAYVLETDSWLRTLGVRLAV
jgi:asparagine synthase (glutamine-hydrolysing)